MRNPEERGFDLLDYLGIDIRIQRLFAPVIHEEDGGRLLFFHHDLAGNTVDQEVFTLKYLKKATQGIRVCTPSGTITDIYVSDSFMNLIVFCQLHSQRFSFRYSTFISTGLKLDRELFLAHWNKWERRKIHTLFGNTLLGRVLDCKIAHWARGQEASFSLNDREVIANTSKGKSAIIPNEEFSMRSYFRRIGGRVPIATHKPAMKSIDNYLNIIFNHKILQP